MAFVLAPTRGSELTRRKATATLFFFLLAGCGKSTSNAKLQPAPMGGQAGSDAVPMPQGGMLAAPAGAGGSPGEPGGAAGEAGEAACIGDACCAEPCATCQQCSGPGGTCVPMPVGQLDAEPAGACVAPSACDGAGRCRPRAQVAAGYAQTCLLLGDGSVRCWGNRYATPGQWEKIGDDEAPATVGPLDLPAGVVQLAAGHSFMCALFSGGNVRCWGYDGGDGQLGYGLLSDDVAAVEAPDLEMGGKALQITAGHHHGCALLEGGSVRCWGDATGASSGVHPGNGLTPVEAGDVDIGSPVIEVSAGKFHDCFLLPDRSGRWWGLNTNDFPAGFDDVVTDIQVFERDAVEIAAGRHTCALLPGGKVRCWGASQAGIGMLGYGDSESRWNAPGLPDVPVGGTVKQIVAGEYHTCALLEGGKVRCWGLGEDGQLGYGNTERIGDDEPAEAAGDVDVGGEVLELSAGYRHTCALLADDRIRCWGLNDFGQLGYGHTENIGDDETPASAGDVPYR